MTCTIVKSVKKIKVFIQIGRYFAILPFCHPIGTFLINVGKNAGKSHPFPLIINTLSHFSRVVYI